MTVTVVTFAFETVPVPPDVTAQNCPTGLPPAAIVASKVCPLATAVGKAKAPLWPTGVVSPPLSCRVTVPPGARPVTVPPTVNVIALHTTVMLVTFALPIVPMGFERTHVSSTGALGLAVSVTA